VYDGNNNLLSVVNAQANAATFAYDAQFRLIERTDPLGNKTQVGYDAKHNVTSTRDGETNQMTNTDLPPGFRQTVTDPRGTVATLTYDATGNPATSTVGAHPPVTFVHDAIGRMTSLKDQVNAEVRLEYNNRNLVTKKTDRLGKESLHTYDNAGRITSTTDRKGITTSYTYTPGGKVASVTAPGISITYTYDIRDHLVSMQDGLGTTSYIYDAASRLTSMTDPHGFTVGYAYDAAGNLTTLTYPGGKQVTYTYDSLNRLVGVSTWLATQNTANFVYDAAGRPVRMNQFNGTFTTYGFDKANRLLRLENRRSESDSICFYRFTLDGSGNRTRIVQNEPLRPQMPAESTPYAYNAQKNRLLTAGTNSFTYDDEGQLVTNNAATYTFDSLHRLTAVSGTPAMQFAFDGASRRLRATRGGIETRYIYDAAGNVLAEADASNTITRYYVHGLGLMATITPADQLHCYHFNAIGSTVAMTDSGKTVVNAYCYSPFGRLLNSQKVFEQPFTFVGGLGVIADSAVEYHMGARSYDSRIGRFISEDPIGESGGINVFAYSDNSPMLKVDPFGRSGWIFVGPLLPRPTAAEIAAGGRIIGGDFVRWGSLAIAASPQFDPELDERWNELNDAQEIVTDAFNKATDETKDKAKEDAIIAAQNRDTAMLIDINNQRSKASGYPTSAQQQGGNSSTLTPSVNTPRQGGKPGT
ncbi:MAG: RHS repeat-associated core domain-containing protein, partial [Fimbriimonadaceae bacterium]